MDLLNQDILDSQSFSFLCSFFKNSKKHPEVSYQTFKLNLVTFAKNVMKNYIKDTPYSSDMCHCFCYEKMDSQGFYNPKFNIIFIKEELVKHMYEKKDFIIMSILFHELNHFNLNTIYN